MKFNETLLTQVNQGRQTRRIVRTRKSNPLVLLIWLHVKKVFSLQRRTYIMSWNHDSIFHHLSNWQDQHTSFILKVYFLFHVLNCLFFWCRFVSPLFHLALKQSFSLCSYFLELQREPMKEGCSVEDPGAVSQVGKNEGGKKEEDNTPRDLHNSSDDAKAEFNNCFIIQLK